MNATVERCKIPANHLGCMFNIVQPFTTYKVVQGFLSDFRVSAKLGFYYTLYLGLSPCPVTVTSRIIVFLVGDPNLNLHLPLESWEGGQPKLYQFWICLVWMFCVLLFYFGICLELFQLWWPIICKPLTKVFHGPDETQSSGRHPSQELS